MAGALEGDLFVGPKAQEHRGLLSIRYPMEHGVVNDWNDMERIWQYIYSKDQLQTFSEEHPVLLTEAPLNPRQVFLKLKQNLDKTQTKIPDKPSKKTIYCDLTKNITAGY